MSESLRFSLPLVLCRRGRRPYNQDYTLPRESEQVRNAPLFVVCDGVGGQAGGEIASQLSAETLEKWYQSHPDRPRDAFFAKQAILLAEKNLATYAEKHPKYSMMSTTVVMAVPQENGKLLIGWAGDSVAIHARFGNVRFKTKEHSLVNRLLEDGLITPEQAETHPKRNVITNCLSAGWKPAQLAIEVLDDIQPGDAIILCSDGVLEAFEPEELASLAQPVFMSDPLELLERISDQCEEKSYDNYSLILLIVE